MTEHDFAETYTYLELFFKSYVVHENEVEIALKAILDTYMLEYNHKDPIHALRMLRNPRGAGRKALTTTEDVVCVMKLHNSGNSIRSIAEETGLSKSTVQRLLKKQLSRN